jgi:hypothetical protein
MQTSASSPASAAKAGAHNLLAGCAGVKRGDTVLLIVEPPGEGYYDDDMGAFIAAEAEGLGALPTILESPSSCDPDKPPADVMAAIAATDHTIFLSRIGDQLRFRPLPGAGTKTMSYALDFDFLASPFGTTPFGLLFDAAINLSGRLAQAKTYRIQCPLGTDLTMALGEGRPLAAGDFVVKTFPMMILPPLSSAGANGTLVLSQSLTSTYIHAYDDSIIPLDRPLTLTIEGGRIVGMEGEPEAVARTKAQFERVASLFGEPVFTVNSWHAGVNPTTWFPRPALSDIDRWAGVVFGSPRYVHFHMCGPSPGDICGQVFDPTISFDGEALWDGGRLAFLDRADNLALLQRYGVGPEAYKTRRDIGLTGEAA